MSQKNSINKLKIFADILCVISGDLASNRGRIIQLVAGWAHFTHFYAYSSYSITFCNKMEAARDVISGAVVEQVGIGVSVYNVTDVKSFTVY